MLHQITKQMIQTHFGSDAGMDELLAKMLELVSMNTNLEQQVVRQLQDIEQINTKYASLKRDYDSVVAVMNTFEIPIPPTTSNG